MQQEADILAQALADASPATIQMLPQLAQSRLSQWDAAVEGAAVKEDPNEYEYDVDDEENDLNEVDE